MKKVFDINDYRSKKEIEKMELAREKEKIMNDDIIKEIISKPVKELTDKELDVYSEIRVIFSFRFREVHQVFVVEFRGQIYLMNFLGNGTFEYLGTLEDILEKSIY